jgi:hypothetical protein
MTFVLIVNLYLERLNVNPNILILNAVMLPDFTLLELNECHNLEIKISQVLKAIICIVYPVLLFPLTLHRLDISLTS